MIPPAAAARAWRASHGYLDDAAWPGVTGEGEGGGVAGPGGTGGAAWWETLAGPAPLSPGGRAEAGGGGGAGGRGGGCGDGRPHTTPSHALSPPAGRVRAPG